jgi:hypothetical protein
LQATFTAPNGFASGGGSNQVTLSGLRMSCKITADGNNPVLELRIWGMDPSLMNELSTFAKSPYITGSSVALQAGTANTGLGIAFIGMVTLAQQDFQSMPDCALHVVAITTMEMKLKPVPPLSYTGATDVVTIMSSIAKTAGLVFENSGVSGIMLSNPYLPGTAFDQMQRVKDAAGINAVVDNGTLAIWPKGQARNSQEVLISAETGMIGYPISSPPGMAVSCLFNPNIKFGGTVRVQSKDIPQANGSWTVFGINHELESEKPSGHWRTTIQAGWARHGTAGPGRHGTARHGTARRGAAGQAWPSIDQVLGTHPKLPDRIKAAGGMSTLNAVGNIVIPPRDPN